MEFVLCYFFRKVTKNRGCDDSFGLGQLAGSAFSLPQIKEVFKQLNDLKLY